MKFEILTGVQAYTIWLVYHCIHPSIGLAISTDRSFEIIIADDSMLLAYRCNLKNNYCQIFENNGIWQFTTDVDRIGSGEYLRLKLICRNFTTN